jgi:hypothetical protein
LDSADYFVAFHGISPMPFIAGNAGIVAGAHVGAPLRHDFDVKQCRNIGFNDLPMRRDDPLWLPASRSLYAVANADDFIDRNDDNIACTYAC